MEPQNTQNTQMDADEAEVNRLSSHQLPRPRLQLKRIIWLDGALA
jgi:hypothetical protein